MFLFLFRFVHPKAEIKVLSSTEVIVNNVNETVTFSPIKADLTFKLPVNIHQSSLMSHPPQVVVISQGKELATTPLHLGILLSHDQVRKLLFYVYELCITDIIFNICSLNMCFI